MGNKKTYLAGCSWGKDSTATILLALLHDEPLDGVVYVRVMFDGERSAEVPEHEDFIWNVAIPKVESWGIKVHVVESEMTFLDCFYRVRCRGANEGRIAGFPIPGLCDVQRDCKVKTLKRAQSMFSKDVTWYTGIAKDEPSRLKSMSSNQVSLLDKYGYDEARAKRLCKKNGLLSPVYEFTDRNGCFFCPNQKDKQLLHLKEHHPDLWKKLINLEMSGNRSLDNAGRAKFNRKETFTELDKRLDFCLL